MKGWVLSPAHQQIVSQDPHGAPRGETTVIPILQASKLRLRFSSLLNVHIAREWKSSNGKLGPASTPQVPLCHPGPGHALREAPLLDSALEEMESWVSLADPGPRSPSVPRARPRLPVPTGVTVAQGITHWPWPRSLARCSGSCRCSSRCRQTPSVALQLRSQARRAASSLRAPWAVAQRLQPRRVLGNGASPLRMVTATRGRTSSSLPRQQGGAWGDSSPCFHHGGCC